MTVEDIMIRTHNIKNNALDKFYAGAPNFPVIVGANQDISNIFKESASLQSLWYL